MGKAAEIAKRDMGKRIAHFKRLKKKFLKELPDYLDEYVL
jgi:cysteine sulfinate desulfinase/cysteine desulfurase-like protein